MSDIHLILNSVFYTYHARETWRLEPGRLPREPYAQPKRRKRAPAQAVAPGEPAAPGVRSAVPPLEVLLSEGKAVPTSRPVDCGCELVGAAEEDRN